MIAFLIDADNFSAPSWIDEAFQTLERTEGLIAIRRAYGSSENLKGLADTLRTWAIRPFVNLPLSKNTTDMSLAIDAMELACLVPRPELVVIGSGDLDFVPLVVRLRERGIKVVCISEKRKMAVDAVSAYDKVIYVSSNPLASLTVAKEFVQTPIAKKVASMPQKKAIKKSPAAKIVKSKPEPAKKAPAKKAAKQIAPRQSAEISVHQILAAAPDLQAGQWISLGSVAKMLHDVKLLGKNATSTKLFKKFPEYFELKPVKQPNAIRLIRQS